MFLANTTQSFAILSASISFRDVTTACFCVRFLSEQYWFDGENGDFRFDFEVYFLWYGFCPPLCSASGVCQSWGPAILRPNYELLPCGLFITLLVCFTFYDFSAFWFSNFFLVVFRDKQATEISCIFMFTVEILIYLMYCLQTGPYNAMLLYASVYEAPGL